MPNTILICRHNKNGTGYCEHLGEYCVEGPCTAEEWIEYALVRYGRWVKTCVPDIYQCSYCKMPTKMDELCDSENLRPFCPNCGAIMDKEE